MVPIWIDKLSIVIGLLYFVNLRESAPIAVLENTSNKFRGTFFPRRVGFMPNAESLKLNVVLDIKGGGLRLNLAIFLVFLNIL